MRTPIPNSTIVPWAAELSAEGSPLVRFARTRQACRVSQLAWLKVGDWGGIRLFEQLNKTSRVESWKPLGPNISSSPNHPYTVSLFLLPWTTSSSRLSMKLRNPIHALLHEWHRPDTLSSGRERFAGAHQAAGSADAGRSAAPSMLVPPCALPANVGVRNALVNTLSPAAIATLGGRVPTTRAYLEALCESRH